MNAKIITPKDYEKRAFNLFFDRVEKKDYIGALGIMHARYEKNPTDKAVLKNLADVYSKMEEYARALFFRFKLLSLTSKENRLFVIKDIVLDVDALDNMALVNFYLTKIYNDYGKDGMYAVANELSEKLAIRNKFEPFYVAYPPNEKHYKRILEYGKQSVNSFSAISAIAFFEQVPLEIFDAESIKDYATAFTFLDDCDGAIKKLKEFLAIKGEKTYIYAYISLMHFYSNNKEKTEFYLEKALSLFDGSEGEALDLYELIKELSPNQRFLPVYEKLSVVYEYNAEYHYEFARVLIASGDTERAMEEINLALKLEPDNATYYLYEKRLSGCENLEEEKKISKKSRNSDDNAIYLDSILRLEESAIAKSAVYTCMESMSPKIMRVLDDALLDLQVASDIKHTIVYAKISYGYSEPIRVVIDGKFYEIYPKKLNKEAQKNTFYTSMYALSVSKTFESGLCSESALKSAVNKVYKTFGNKIKSDEGLRDLTTVVCILAIKDLSENTLIKSFDANEKKVKKYLNEIKGLDQND